MDNELAMYDPFISAVRPFTPGIAIHIVAPTRFLAAIEAFVEEKKLDREDQEFQKVMVPDANNSEVQKERAFFPPLYQTRSPFSRATRPMLAFDLKTKTLVFLKDIWRPNFAGIEKEGDIYRVLHTHKVDYIAEFRTGNGVYDHVMRTQEFIYKCWALQRPLGGEAVVLTPLCQYRMTLFVIEEPLVNFKSSKQLVAAIADAMKAHDEAYFKAGILHRDISIGNIINDGAGGLLVDWDMCVKGNLEKRVARRPKRTGTWQFMSIHLLREQNHYHDIEDDRESALYVLLWTALRYTKHRDIGEIKGSTAKDLLAAFDEVRPDGNEQYRGGNSKYVFLGSQTKLRFDGRPQLDALFMHLRQAFLVRYQETPVVQNQDPFVLEVLTRHNATALENLRKENWLVSVIQEYLDKEGWPSDDKTEPQETDIQVTTSHKRAPDQEKIKAETKRGFDLVGQSD